MKTVEERILDRLTSIDETLKELLAITKKQREDEDWDIPIECPVSDCGLVCNTQDEFDAHVKKEHPGY